MAAQNKSEDAVEAKSTTVRIKHIRSTMSKYPEYLGDRVVRPEEVLELEWAKALPLLGMSRERKACCGSTTTQVVRFFERVNN